MTRIGLLCLSAVTCIHLWNANAQAQIEIDQLSPAASYDSGALAPSTGGLPASLWQGTNSQTARDLFNLVGVEMNGTARELARAAVLSEGVPPQSELELEREAYLKSRLEAVLKLGDLSAFDAIARISDPNARIGTLMPVYAKRALLGGDTAGACTLSDTVTTERKLPVWSKLRAFCHVVRDEVPAAELTADLLKRSDHNDPAFFNLLGNLTGSVIKKPVFGDVSSAQHVALARLLIELKPDLKVGQIKSRPLAASIALSEQASAGTRFAALKTAANLLSPDETKQVFLSLAGEEALSANALVTKETWAAEDWGSALSTINATPDSSATAALTGKALREADKAGLLKEIGAVLSNDIAIIPHQLQAQTDGLVFAKFAVEKRDLSGLRSLYENLNDDDPLRSRIALASDALGGGFLMSEMGTDIETRLSANGDGKIRATRDAFIAASLGANVDVRMLAHLIDTTDRPKSAGSPGKLLALKTAARRQAQAEVALLAAHIFEATPPQNMGAADLANILFALNDAGLREQASIIAARDFLRP